ncbi:site-specific DNA-methyltransferase [Humibacter ginsengiterrae]
MTEFVPGETTDERLALLSQLKDLIPAAFLDGALDAAALLEALELDRNQTSGFVFTWPGIEKARADALEPTTATLIPDPEASLNWETARDVLVEGDNLQVLKLLKNAYSDQAKLIYIDPPYNTGDTFTYNDKFAVPERQYLEETGQVDEHGDATTSKVETGGRKHAPWLTMMFSRLVVARHLLRRDGAILVSIDNNEVHHLRLLLDAVFGAENFVDMMTWRGARKGDGKLTGGGQDYILVYARDRSWLRINDVRWREHKNGLDKIYAKVAELQDEFGDDFEAASKAMRAWYRSLSDDDPSKEHQAYSRIDDRGVWFSDNISSPNYRENLHYTWRGFEPPENGWRYEEATMERLEADGRLIYPADKTKRVQIKAYLHMREEWAPPSVFYRDRRAASGALNALMDPGTKNPKKVFDDPKSTDVLARLFHSMTDDGDLIVDFFAGSGSTGQAVWEQNPRDDKTRHWVLVQLPEEPDTSSDAGKNAVAFGYKTIFEITAERLRRAAAKIGGNLGFRIFRTRPTNLIIDEDIIATEELSSQVYLDNVLHRAFGSPIVDGADDIDLVWEIALKATATQLDARVKELSFDGVKVYEFTPAVLDPDSGRLLISLDAFTLDTSDKLGITDDDTLILRGEAVEDGVTLTLAPRLQSRLVLLERVPREVSL